MINVLNTLAEEITVWGSNNFTFFGPRIGVLEEIGEAAHCILKRYQGIRGFDNEKFFLEQLEDAVSDACVYLLNDAGLHGFKFVTGDGETITQIQDEHTIHAPDQSEVEDALSDLASCASNLLSDVGHWGTHSVYIELIGQLWALAATFGVDNPLGGLQKTWDKVKQRNWKDNPQNAAQIAEENLVNEKTDEASQAATP